MKNGIYALLLVLNCVMCAINWLEWPCIISAFTAGWISAAIALQELTGSKQPKDKLEKEESAAVESTSQTHCSVFFGENSAELWNEINSLDEMSTGADIRNVLFSLGCALQKLEAKIAPSD